MGSMDVYRKMSDGDKKLLEEVEANSKEVKMGNWYDSSYWFVDIYKCSEDLLFKKYHMALRVTKDSKYYLEISEGGNYEDYENNKLYQVPEKYYDGIEDIFEDALEETEYMFEEGDSYEYY